MQLLNDMRYAMRGLLTRPGFTIVAVLTLALGIGANTAIFSVVNGVLLRPLPFKDPERLMMVWERRTNSGAANLPVSGHEYIAWRDGAHSFEALSIVQPDELNLTGQGEATMVSGGRVSAEFFKVIGVSPLLGRGFAAGEDQQGGAKVAILGEKLWRQRFAADPNVINREVTLNDQKFVVIGVLPKLELMPDVLIPIDLRSEVQKVGKHSHQVMGRLNAGVSMGQAQTELAAISRGLEEKFADANQGHGVQVVRLHDEVTGSAQLPLLVMLGAVGFVLLIACANVANLLLTRVASRQREMAIRTALGAGRWRLIQQMLTESLLLSLLGAGVGLIFVVWLVDILRKVTATNLPRLDQVSVDGYVLLVTVTFSLITGLLTGVIPAWRSSETRLQRWLSDGSRTTAGRGRRRIGSALVVIEVALSVVLLIGGGLMLKSFIQLIRVNPGFNPHQVLRLDLALPPLKYRQPQQQRAFYEQLLQNLQTLPGVESVGATTQTPLSPGDNWSSFAIEGQREVPPGQLQEAAVRAVSNDYFKSLQIPLRKGRIFSNSDARVALPVLRWFPQQPYPEHFNDPQPEPAVLINETMARLYWPNEDPLGRRLKIVESPWLTVVGVVGDVRHNGLSTKPNPEIYLSYLQEPQSSLAVMVRTSGDPLSLATAAREQVRTLDKDEPVTVTTMDDVFSRSVAGQRFNALLLGSFAGLALLLAMTGVFSVINYSVTQRTHEIGIRIALGALRIDVVRLVLAQGFGLALTGIALGVLGAVALTRLMTSLLFGVSPLDLFTFVWVSAAVLAVALFACYLPARRATKVDPLVALRYE